MSSNYRQSLINKFASFRSGSTFVKISNYKNNSGEVSDYGIIFHFSYHNALEKSVDIMNSFTPANDLEKKAKEELILSFKKSLEKPEVSEDDNVYEHFFDNQNQVIKGIKLHTKDNILHLYGLQFHKKVIEPGIYKKVKSSELTITKNKLKEFTPLSKFRQFKLDSCKFDSISIEGLKLEDKNGILQFT